MSDLFIIKKKTTYLPYTISRQKYNFFLKQPTLFYSFPIFFLKGKRA